MSFGAGVRTVTPAIAAAHGLPAAYGVEVGPVRDGSPAAVAGVRSGDVITAIGAYTLTGGEAQFRTAVAARHPGDSHGDHGLAGRRARGPGGPVPRC